MTDNPMCPKCGSFLTKETLISANKIPVEFYASTTYECLDCKTQWITGDYVISLNKSKEMTENEL